MEYYAHTPNNDGDWHELKTHIREVARLARVFAAAFDAGDLAYTAGMLHDTGKYHELFQRYLNLCAADPDTKRRGPDHKAAGTLLARESKLNLLTFLIQGHHGGLHAPDWINNWLTKHRDEDEARLHSAIALAQRDLPELVPMPLPAPPPSLPRDRLGQEFFLRMLFSALVDADFLDTERHFTGWKASARETDLTLIDLLDRFNATAPAPTSEMSETVHRGREAMFAACVAAAEDAPGFFRLTMPTGGGKTRSGMAFALHHARKYGKRQIIVAVPFITITQQTAQEYRRVFERPGDARRAVLEHHSAATIQDAADPSYGRDANWSRLAAENWDAPVIVTTTVQLFESLFAAGTAPCRKLHRLANSVLILDEAQALPPQLLPPILDALRQLVTHYRTTVVFSTATQPAFEQIAPFRDLDPSPREIVPDHARHFADFARVTYEWRTDREYPFAEVAGWLHDAPQSLAVLNTKADALAMLAALADENALHLSTLLCGAHRTAVIDTVRQRLKDGEPCRLVTTQVIEAGVDLDFPLVLRAFAPLDSVIQAAGRCNRGGRMERGRVIVFDPEGKHMPGATYRAATARTRRLVTDGDVNPDDPATISGYFADWYKLLNPDEQRIAVEIGEARKALDYPTVAEKFQMIDDSTQTAIVTGYDVPAGAKENAHVRRLVEKLRGRYGSVRETMRQVQPYTVNIYSRLVDEYQQLGLLTGVIPGVWEWHGKYDKTTGLVPERNPDSLVF